MRLQTIETDIRKLNSLLKSTREERKTLADEQLQCLEKRNQLDLVIKDLEDDVEREITGKVNFYCSWIFFFTAIRANEFGLS